MGGIALILAALVLPCITPAANAAIPTSGAVALGVAIISMNAQHGHLNVPDMARGAIVLAVEGAYTRTTAPHRHEEIYVKRLKMIREASGIPPLEGSSDIYSFGQARLISTGAHWSPRPVFQSYSAYTPDLLMKNAQHLLEHGAPDTIVFSVEPIDGRFPSIEDGASWPLLYTLYGLKSVGDRYAVLERRRSAPGRLVELASHPGKLHEQVTVPDFDGEIYVSIRIKPRLMGRVRSLLYKPTPLMMEVTLKNGQRRNFRISSGMTQTGFLVSPLVEETSEFAQLYGDPSCWPTSGSSRSGCTR